MENTQALTLLKKKYSFPILDAIQADIEIIDNPFGLRPESLFTMAGRINKKRSFLFVSKVLGKHLPINPNKGLVTSALLAARFLETVKGIECSKKEELLALFQGENQGNATAFIPESIDPLIVGFAETATALGHAFFDCFQNAHFFHTTREEINGRNPAILFEEEHSHATSHRCYIPEDILRTRREVILVDDELTTGNTALNIIRSIHSRFPRDHYTVVSILDWRTAESRAQFVRTEQELGTRIHVVSLLSGNVQIRKISEITRKQAESLEINEANMDVKKIDLASLFTPSPFTTKTGFTQVPFIWETGRFGMDRQRCHSLGQTITKAAAVLKENRTGTKTLCLGTGEFMYLPMKISAAMGSGVSYQSTTRSPIFVENRQGYGARFGITLPNPEDPAVTHYVYNIPAGYYDEVFVFFEREIAWKNLSPLLRELEKLQTKSVKVVFFSTARGE